MTRPGMVRHFWLILTLISLMVGCDNGHKHTLVWDNGATFTDDKGREDVDFYSCTGCDVMAHVKIDCNTGDADTSYWTQQRDSRHVDVHSKPGCP
jgi:hypothetical protein